jgi:hypothetical protein
MEDRVLGAAREGDMPIRFSTTARAAANRPRRNTWSAASIRVHAARGRSRAREQRLEPARMLVEDGEVAHTPLPLGEARAVQAEEGRGSRAFTHLSRADQPPQELAPSR